MTIVVGTNSYCDIVYADSYFSSRWGADPWDALTDPEKEKALLSAMPILEGYCSWLGYKTDSAQALSFPRDGDTDVPIDIKNGQCELAFSVISSGGVISTNSAPVTELKADTVQLKFGNGGAITNTLYNSYIAGFLNGYCYSGTAKGGSGTGRVIRT